MHFLLKCLYQAIKESGHVIVCDSARDLDIFV
jgi:hypothetical protein